MKKAAAKTANIDMTGFQPRVRVFDGQTPPAASDPSTQASAAPRSMIGAASVIAGITHGHDLSQQLEDAKAKLEAKSTQLASFEGATLVILMDPRQIRRSRWANRIEAEFGTAEFAQLKEEIQSSAGNVQPIKARAITGEITNKAGVFDGQTPTHEIVFGHRRHQACLELGLPVSVIVVDSMSDQQLFEAMDRENRGRKNLSAWEQGRMYQDALDKALYPSLRKLAESLGVNVSDASRAIGLAKLPEDVVRAFQTPLDLQVRWAKPLSDALQKDPDGVLTRARELLVNVGPRVASDVFDQLVGKIRAAQAQSLLISAAGKQVATLTAGPKGRAVIEIESGALAPGRYPALAKLLQEFLSK